MHKNAKFVVEIYNDVCITFVHIIRQSTDLLVSQFLKLLWDDKNGENLNEA